MLNVRCSICHHVIVCQSQITKIQIDKAALLFCHVFHHHRAIHHIVRLSRDVNDLLLSVILLVFYPCNVLSCPSLVVQRLFWLSFLLLYSIFETSIDIKVLINIHLLDLWSKISLAFLSILVKITLLFLGHRVVAKTTVDVTARVDNIILNYVLDERVFIEMDLV